MAVNYNRLKSTRGFESPGFVVDANGNLASSGTLSGTSLTLTGAITSSSISTNTITIANQPLFTNGGTVLSPTVIGSSLMSLIICSL